MIEWVRFCPEPRMIDQGWCLIVFVMLIAATWAMSPVGSVKAQEELPITYHQVEPGDTWAALSRRYNIVETEIRAANPAINPQPQPAIGTQIIIPATAIRESTGTLVTSNNGGLLQLAVQYNQLPWLLASINDLNNPNRPLSYRPVLIPGGHTSIRELPVGLDSLEISSVTARPGEALALRASGPSVNRVTASLDGQSINIVANGHRMVGLFGTGAFYAPGNHELRLSIEGEPLWSQHWNFPPVNCTFE
jgi:LysM repeat protein